MAFVYWIRAPHHTDIFSEGYVGFTSTTVKKRLKGHKDDSERDHCKNYPIYRAFRKYGESLIVETIAEGPSDWCLDLELRLRPTQKIGWNLSCGGEAGSLGSKMSEETKVKKSEAMKGSRNHFYGKKHSDETKNKISQVKKGRSGWSDEARKRASEQRKGKKLNLCAEQHKNRSERAKLRRHSSDTRAKISDSRKELNLRPWDSYRANKDLWLLADQAFHFIKDNPLAGERRLCMAVLGHDVQCKMLLKMLRNGWNPLDDNDWLIFRGRQDKAKHGN